MANKTTGPGGTDDRDNLGTGSRGSGDAEQGSMGSEGLDRDRGTIDRDLDEEVDPKDVNRGGQGNLGNQGTRNPGGSDR